MTIGFLNYDSSFFQASIEGIKSTTMKKDISDRIQSLEIVEEMGKVLTGNIQIVDYDDLRYTNVLKGKRITVKWGYTNVDLSGQQAFRKANNARELFSPTLVNRIASGRLMNPSGGGDENGVFTYNLQFYGTEYQDKSSPKKAPFSSGTKGDVIAQVFTAMGIDSFYIDFKRQKEVLTRDTAIRQTESNFRFLAKYAHEWRALFRIATSNRVRNALADPPEYGLVGIFCDYDKDVTIQAFLQDTLGASGDSSTFEYKLSGSPNVKSYTWQQHQGASGTGDNVRVVVVNGKTEFYYMKADNEEVTYYKLNTAKMQGELSSKGDLRSQTEWMNAMFAEAEKGMSNLVNKKYFIPVKEHTAPQGIGISATLECVGNPLYTCPARAKFSRGFPDIFLTAKGLTFYQTRVSHKINRTGYSCTVQVADSYTVSGGSLVG
jgi:hypothetical protein